MKNTKIFFVYIYFFTNFLLTLKGDYCDEGTLAIYSHPLIYPGKNKVRQIGNTGSATVIHLKKKKIVIEFKILCPHGNENTRITRMYKAF